MNTTPNLEQPANDRLSDHNNSHEQSPNGRTHRRVLELSVKNLDESSLHAIPPCTLGQIGADLDFQVSLIGEGFNAAVTERTLELRVIDRASIRVACLPLVLHLGRLCRGSLLDNGCRS